MPSRPRFLSLCLAIQLTTAMFAAGQDAAVREPAADGTVSVVAATPPDGRGAQAAVSVATDVLSRALEPLDAGGPSEAAAGPRTAVYARPLPLVEALERSGDRARRLWISQAYWKVSAGFAMLRWSSEALEARAAAVLAAQKAMQMAEADHAKGQRPIEAVIAAHAAVTGQQREFVKILRAYNMDIAEYAMAVADLSVPDDRFVSMLIGTPIQWRPQPSVASPAPTTPPTVPVAPPAN